MELGNVPDKHHLAMKDIIYIEEASKWWSYVRMKTEEEVDYVEALKKIYERSIMEYVTQLNKRLNKNLTKEDIKDRLYKRGYDDAKILELLQNSESLDAIPFIMQSEKSKEGYSLRYYMRCGTILIDECGFYGGSHYVYYVKPQEFKI
jgi:hypothetical protein